ncbi:MAG: DUF1990 domain-containing protein [Gemmatimonadota bacterium]
MFRLTQPSTRQIATFLSRQQAQSFSYAEVGATRENSAPDRYTVDHNRIRLGYGAAVFDKAVSALRAWRMAALGWSTVHPASTMILPGATVAVVVRHYGFWSMNACRVVYLLDEESENMRCTGFAYGTLPEHGEAGEERFIVEWHRADDSVWYDLLAFSRPGHVLTRMGYPLARRLQRRFAQGSKQAMVNAVREDAVGVK